MKAVIWNYKYDDMKASWAKQVVWLTEALRLNGFEVKNKGIICEGLDAEPYDHKVDNPCDVCIYNHADSSEIIGNVVKARQNWFLKPTVPDEIHTTLDTLGYGPYSSITYEKPDFEVDGVDEFFETKVKKWIERGTNKWSSKGFQGECEIKEDDYWLILGQCGGDSVNTRHDFGGYFTKLAQVVKELVRLGIKPVVKLHPYTDGKDATDTVYSDDLKAKLEGLGASVYSGKIKLHPFIKKCKGVILGNSGSGFEAMMHKKPIIAWGYPEYHWVSYDLRHLADLKRALELDWFNEKKQSQYLTWYLRDYCFYDQISANKRVKELKEKI